MSIAFEERRETEITEIYSPEAPGTPRNAFSPEVVDRLLEQLSTNDDFRELFHSNPRAALRLVGHETPHHQLELRGTDPVMCMVLNHGLASKEAIRTGLQRMKTVLTSTQAYVIFALSAD
jgi:putative modified peptide